MKTTRYRYTVSLALIAWISALASTLEAASIEYAFTGTLEAGPRRFESPRFISPELSGSEGDPISGRLRFKVPFQGSGFSSSPDSQRFGSNRREADSLLLEVTINGHTLSAFHTTWIDVVNDGDANTALTQYTVERRTDDLVDIFKVTIPPTTVSPNPSGILMDGKMPPDNVLGKLSLELQLTDTQGQAFDSSAFPTSLDLEQFDIAKVILHHSEGSQRAGGLIFNIDTLTQVTPEDTTDALRLRQIDFVKRSGGTIEIEAAANSVAFQSYQWSHNGVDLEGETDPRLVMVGVNAADSGTYRLTARSGTEIHTATARVQVTPVVVNLRPILMRWWNADVIVGPGEAPEDHPFFDGDQGRWMAAEYQGHIDGFPTMRGFGSATTSDVWYHFQRYDRNNALWLQQPEADSTEPRPNVESLRLETPARYNQLAIAAASGGGSGEGTVTLHFLDGTQSRPLPLNAPDWSTPPSRRETVAIAGIASLQGLPGEDLYQSTPHHGYGLYDTLIDLEHLDLQDKFIERLEFAMPVDARTMGVFAVSGEVSDSFHIMLRERTPTSLSLLGIAPTGSRVRLEVSENLHTWAKVTEFSVNDPNGWFFRAVSIKRSKKNEFFRTSLVSED